MLIKEKKFGNRVSQNISFLYLKLASALHLLRTKLIVFP